MMARNPGFTTAAVVALGVGIGANTAVFTVVNSVLLRPLPFPQPERLFFLSAVPKAGPFGPVRHSLGGGIGIPDSTYLKARDQIQAFDPVAVFDLPQPAALAGASEAVRVGRSGVTPEFWPYCASIRRWAAGFSRVTSCPDIDRVVVLSDRSGARSSARIPGSQRRKERHAGWGGPHGDRRHAARFCLSTGGRHVDPQDGPARFSPVHAHVIGRLKPGIPSTRAQAELQTILRPLESNGTSPGNPDNLEIAAIPLREVLVGASRSSLLIFLGAVAFVLLIACANVANLLLMRGAARRQEIAVRVSLGAGRARLVGQLLTESVVLSFAGGSLGMLLAIWAVPALLALAPAGTLPRAAEIHVDAAMLVFTMGLSLLGGLVFGLRRRFSPRSAICAPPLASRLHLHRPRFEARWWWRRWRSP